ncbi:MAG TPA: YbfB/YjiJ family MFS transporter [Ramlibacter sp.]|nr:YbfB/YjiJ family MFS transporter [Ramlibacter sp.]
MANPAATAHAAPPAWAIGLAGLLSLAAAMGVGRFAFTPVLPLMVQAGELDVAGGGWLAAANYVGYLLGALTAARTGWRAPRLAVVALLATVVLTAAMAAPAPVAAWAVLRFLAGVASAWAFVATGAWCLSALAQRGATSWASALYAGVGLGSTLAGLQSLVAGTAGWTPQALWLQLAGMALVLAIPVFAVLRRLPQVAASAAAAAQRHPMPAGTWGLASCYGLFGYGYILPATFLPVLAREVVPDPRLFGLAWPVFGVTAAVSALVAAAVLRRVSRVQVWACSSFAMGVGTLLPALWRNGWTIGLSALLVGGTFMVVTLAGVQETRARVRGDPTPHLGRMTAAFAVGQIVGPIVSSLLLLASPVHGLDVALVTGALALFGSSVWLWRSPASSLPSAQESLHVR